MRRPSQQIWVCTFILALTCGGGAAFAALPITFEENRGQAPPEVLFLSRAAGYRVFLTRQGAVVTLHDGQAVRFRLANSGTAPVGTDLLAAKTNYLRGGDPTAWRTGIGNYSRVTYFQAYPGIDMTWHSRGDDIEHDFRVAPGADPRQIQLVFSGAALHVTADGDLMAGTLHFHKPRAYQENREVQCRYDVHGSRVRFRLGRYNRAQPLTIDPVLSFSTFLGNGSPVATTLDGTSNVYVAGNTTALDFPVTANAFQPTQGNGPTFCFGGPFGKLPIPCYDIFVAKLSGDGKTLLYATYLGGPGDDLVQTIALGPAGKLYFTATYTTNWIPNLALLPGQTAGSRVYVAALSADGSSLVFATVLPVAATALAVDASGAVYLTGKTPSLTGQTTNGLPTVNAFQPKPPESGLFVFKTTDHGSHWQTSANGLPANLPFTFVTADPTNPQVLYAGINGGLFMTRDGGANWTSSVASGLNLHPTSMAIDPRSPQTLYVTGGIAGVYKSTDGGITWVATGSPGELRVGTLAIDPTNSSILYLATSGGLFKSTDGAATWKPTGLVIPPSYQDSGVISQIVIDPTNPETVYASIFYGVVKSTDGGATWNAMNTGFAAAGLPVLGLAMDPASPQTLYAGAWSNGTQYGGIYKTTDGGAHWSQSQWPEPGVAVNTVIVDPELHSRIWAAASTGVFVSLDSGATWSRTPLPHLFVYIAEAADGSVYAVSGGYGALGDAFAMKLDPTGSNLLYSTFLGGSGRDVPGGIAVDAAGRAYIAGETDSPDFPLAAPLQPEFGGNSDVFVTVLDASGSHLVWSTYLGGSGAEGASAIALDSAGNVHLAGTVSPTYPFLASGGNTPADMNIAVADATADAFIGKIKADGSALIYSAHFGGSAFEDTSGVATDAAGNTYIAGTTRSKDIPTVNAVQPALAGGADAYIAAFNGHTGAVQYATYLGGTSDDFARGIAADAAGNVFVAGQTFSQDFPLKNAWQGSFSNNSTFSNFVAKLGVPVSLKGLTNAASYTTTVAPGELVSLFGIGLALGPASAAQLPLPTQLLDAQVMVNGLAAPLVYASPLQLNAQIPFETQTGTAQVQLMSSAGSGTMTVQVAAAAPAIFTLNQQGTGPGAIQHATTYQVVTASQAATAGEIISIYCTGLGEVNPPAQTGAVPPVPPSQTVVPVQVSIGGITVQPLYAGVAPGFPGLYQVNAQIPMGTLSGAQPLQILQNGVASNTATVAVQ